jgi:hypothetical protein
MSISPVTRRLQSLAVGNNLTFQDISGMLGITPQHARALLAGKYPAQPKHIRLIELKLLDRRRTKRRA